MTCSSVIFFLDENGSPQGDIIEGDLADPTADILGRAMRRAEELRREGRRHVTISTENSMLVGKPGVDVTGADYNWKKRRP